MNSIPAMYTKIIQYIRDEIASGNLQPNQKIPTEMDLMERFAVSRATVIKALSELNSKGVIYRVQGSGSFVSDRRESGKKRNMRIISFITPFFDHEIDRFDEREMVRGIEKYSRENGHFLTLHFTEQNPQLEIETIRKCREEEVDGIILYPCVESDYVPLLNELIVDNYPIVTLDNLLYGMAIPCVQTDNKKGGHLATKHLVDRGYDKLFFVTDQKIKVMSTNDRYFGFCAALKESRKELAGDSFVVLAHYLSGNGASKTITYEEHRDVYLKLIRDLTRKHPDRRVGIFAANDYIGLSILKAALELAISVPETIGIVGFDDSDAGANAPLPLTTIKQNFFEIGRRSAETVVGMIKDGQGLRNLVIDVDVELIVRSTT